MPSYDSKSRALRRGFLWKLLMALYLVASPLDPAGRSLLAAKAESEAKSQGESNYYAGKEGLDESNRDAELDERREKGEDPDSPLRDRTEEVRGANVRCLCGRSDNPRKDVCDDDRDEEDKDGDDDLRQVEKNYLLEEHVHLGKAENVEGRYEERYNDEPLHKAAYEGARVEVDASALHDVAEARLFKRRIKLDSANKMRDKLAYESAHYPADDEDDDGCDEIWEELDRA